MPTNPPTNIGDRIRVLASSDFKLEPGMTGTVVAVDWLLDGISITVDWDHGSADDPALVARFGDRWEVIA